MIEIGTGKNNEMGKTCNKEMYFIPTSCANLTASQFERAQHV
jgi:hypothetical protein